MRIENCITNELVAAMAAYVKESVKCGEDKTHNNTESFSHTTHQTPSHFECFDPVELFFWEY